MMPASSPWWLLGAGAMGRLFAARLSVARPVCLIGRRDAPNVLHYRDPSGVDHALDVPCCTLTSLAVSDPTPPGLVVLATKSHDTQSALDALSAHVDARTPLLLLQNGFRVQPIVTRQWLGPVLCASTTEGAYVESAPDGGTRVVHAGTGVTWIGDLDHTWPDLAHGVVEALTAAGMRAQVDDDIAQRLWHKLAVNAAINPLVARHRIRNGQLRDRPFRRMVDALINEIGPLIEGQGIEPPAAGWSALIWQVIEATADNRASMLQDVLAGRPTEREAILGPLRDAARRQQRSTPSLDALYRDTPS
ncbi:ketopantoate reductase family protein [Chromohalobacter israelensis]|uniref:ketopantoate reductase family protein n=1 Tax=Chromohalobacter israelensis TaxID=141390 RepID=UPI00265C8561|nr:2-dehydropantoate 2-reductase [Chromohalobacter salexigens]MDO0946357.1 2-dehydropantoate 2-reductase [Chromohalobacter salexigens]